MTNSKFVGNIMVLIAGIMLYSTSAVAKIEWLPDYSRKHMNVGRIIDGGDVSPRAIMCEKKGYLSAKEPGKKCKEHRFPGKLVCYSCECSTEYKYSEGATCPTGKKLDPIPCDGMYRCVDCTPCPSPWTAKRPASGVVAEVKSPDSDSSCGNCYYACPTSYEVATAKTNAGRFIGGWKIPYEEKCVKYAGPSNVDGTSLCYAPKEPICEDWGYLSAEDSSLPCKAKTVSACGKELSCHECSCDVCNTAEYPYDSSNCPSPNVLAGKKCCNRAERCDCPTGSVLASSCQGGCAVEEVNGCCAQCKCTPNPECTAENYPYTQTYPSRIYESCTPGCGDNTVRYRVVGCASGYTDYGNNICCPEGYTNNPDCGKYDKEVTPGGAEFSGCRRCELCVPDVTCTNENYPYTKDIERSLPQYTAFQTCSPGCGDDTLKYRIYACPHPYKLVDGWCVNCTKWYAYSFTDASFGTYSSMAYVNSNLARAVGNRCVHYNNAKIANCPGTGGKYLYECISTKRVLETDCKKSGGKPVNCETIWRSYNGQTQWSSGEDVSLCESCEGAAMETCPKDWYTEESCKAKEQSLDGKCFSINYASSSTGTCQVVKCSDTRIAKISINRRALAVSGETCVENGVTYYQYCDCDTSANKFQTSASSYEQLTTGVRFGGAGVSSSGGAFDLCVSESLTTKWRPKNHPYSSVACDISDFKDKYFPGANMVAPTGEPLTKRLLSSPWVYYPW